MIRFPYWMISRSDQADCLWDTLLELNMPLKDLRHAGKRLFKFQLYIVAIRESGIPRP
jgi:hypothetical protein